jgi:hypothetical protein
LHGKLLGAPARAIEPVRERTLGHPKERNARLRRVPAKKSLEWAMMFTVASPSGFYRYLCENGLTRNVRTEA